MRVRIEESWRRRLQLEFDKPYFARLAEFVREEYRTQRVCPVNRDLFRVFDLCPFDRVRVVILGQDPYPDPRFYYGICFSVPDGLPVPGSLQNIFREIHDDTGRPVPASGRAADELDLDRACFPERFAPRPRLGDVHRCGDPTSERRARTPGLHALGIVRPAEGGDHRPLASSGALGRAPFAAFGRPGILRMPSFQPGERLSATTRNPRNRVVIPGIIPFLPFLSVQTFFLGVPGDRGVSGFLRCPRFPWRLGVFVAFSGF